MLEKESHLETKVNMVNEASLQYKSTASVEYSGLGGKEVILWHSGHEGVWLTRPSFLPAPTFTYTSEIWSWERGLSWSQTAS